MPLRHADPSRPDDRLAADAAAHLARHPSLQLCAELYARLREMAFPWWTPEQLREAFPAAMRFGWLSERPDLRQRITTQLTGLAPRAARNKSFEFQASLVDSVIDEGDISVEAFENAFEPSDLSVYAPAEEIWRLFRRRMPWDDDATSHQDLVGWLIGALLADKSALDGSPRTPVLTAIQVRTAIDGRVWHSRIPLHVRVAIDDARFAAQRERPHEIFGVERDLSIATPALIAASVPLRDLLGVMDVATHALGFDDGASPTRAHPREGAARRLPPLPPEDDEIPPRAEPPRDEPPAAEEDAEEAEAPKTEAPPEMEPPAPSEERPPAIDPFNDEPTSDSRDVARDSVTDELEHTNPWLVPQLSSELAQIAKGLAKDIRDKKKT